MVMDRFDFSPLFRSTIGFDRLARLVDAATHVDSAALSYPPYNIEKVGEDAYRLTMAVAGFSRDEIEIVVQENTLTVSGKAQNEEENASYWCGASGTPSHASRSRRAVFDTARSTRPREFYHRGGGDAAWRACNGL